MSTRSMIAQEQPDGTLKGVYVHSDGYLEGVGQQLLEWVGGVTPERRRFVVDKLLAEKIGWSSLCNTDIDLEPGWIEYKEGKYKNWEDYYNDPEHKRPQSYTARGEKEKMKQDFTDLADMTDGSWCEYFYVFSQDLSTMKVYVSATNLLGTVPLAEVQRIVLGGKSRSEDIEHWVKERGAEE